MRHSTLFAVPLAATLLVSGLATPAQASIPVYDARTLGMGGNSVGYAANGSLVYWNPAAVANSQNFGLFLPTLGVSVSNTVLGVGQLTPLLGAASGGFTALGGLLGNGNDSLLGKLGSADGLNIQARALIEPFGISLGKVGPGSLALRVYGNVNGVAGLNLSSDFAQDINGLVLQNGFSEIVSAAQGVGAGAAAGLTGDTTALNKSVGDLRGALEKNMKSFIIDGKNKTSGTKKSFSATTMTGTTGAVAATYAQQFPLPGAFSERFPDAQLSVGVTGKVLQSGSGLLAGVVPSLPLPGGPSGASFNPLAGSAAISLDMDQEVTALVNSIAAFQQDGTNLATIGDLLGSVQGFLTKGLPKTTVNFSSLTPANTGVAADVGAHLRIDRWWSLGLTLVNPVLFWNAQRVNYKYVFNPSSTTTPLSLVQDGAPQNVAFRVAEPFAVRAGLAFTPQLEGKGPGFLVNDILLTAGLDAPIITGLDLPNRPVLSLGFEKLFGPLALRLGTQQFGYAPFYTAGLGIQTRWVQLNVGAGTDLPAIRGGAVSATMGIGF
ncbi:MAG: hypothetical protein VKP62_07255 [Candidatus Sericytochromatia bacterium]|nr:hypothetical protein [Candidatus Sericytochromatia bacterium]